MASVQIGTSTWANVWHSAARAVGIAGSRIWTIKSDTTTPTIGLFYSDTGGASWTTHTANMGTGVGALKVYKDGSNVWHVAVAMAGVNVLPGNVALTFRQIHSNVDTGTPGALTTATTVNAGAANGGSALPFIEVVTAAARPRIFISAIKQTSASANQLNLYYAGLGTSGDAAGNWSTISGYLATSTSGGKYGIPRYIPSWGGSPRLALVVYTGAGTSGQVYVFDPTPAAGSVAVGTPKTGVGAVVSGTWTAPTSNATPVGVDVAVKNDYICIGRADASDGTIGWFDTTDNVTWSTVSTATVAGNMVALDSDGTNVYTVHTTGTGTPSSSVSAMNVRTITPGTPGTLGAASVFSDQSGQQPSIDVDGSTLYCVYRTGTATPWAVYFDSVPLGGPAVVPQSQPIVISQALVQSYNR